MRHPDAQKLDNQISITHNCAYYISLTEKNGFKAISKDEQQKRKTNKKRLEQEEQMLMKTICPRTQRLNRLSSCAGSSRLPFQRGPEPIQQETQSHTWET